MKIAVVGPSPVPYVYGGTEGLIWKLVESFNSSGSHQAELIKLPTREHGFWDLIESYRDFHRLDLSHFDMVVSTKYPSWMSKHRNHVVYMVHHLRGLFDAYHFFNEPLIIPEHLRKGGVSEILELIQEENSSDEIVEEVFNRLALLKKEESTYDRDTFKFPGPFIRAIIHFFDAYALAPGRIKRYYSISDNVKLREDYFPKKVQVKTLYPPSWIDGLKCVDYEYLFTISRLDQPKRIDLMIKAMKYVPYPVKLKIAGTGPAEARLRVLAGNDERIEFLGFVKEGQLKDLYAKALVVLFMPYDEDYGLITIEAMMSKKPVITAVDSGGPLEFVTDSETGYIVQPNPQIIAQKINYLVENPLEAHNMGHMACQKVKDITWANVVNGLAGHGDMPARTKILVLSTFSSYPPRGGGQHRIFNLYSQLARRFDITICSIVEVSRYSQDLILNNGLKQISVPQSKEHAESQRKKERALGLNLFDVCMIDLVELSDDYVKMVRELIDESDIVVFSHPYLYSLHKHIGPGKIVIYDSHNVEYLLKKNYINNFDLCKKIQITERAACQDSDLVLTTSEEDKKDLVNLYGEDPNKVLVVPNGVDASRIGLVTDYDRIKQKDLVGLGGSPVILFVGSWHPPNLEALRFIIDVLGRRFPNHIFMIVGSVKNYYLKDCGDLPKNVMAFGVVDEEEKYELYKLADIAINPMFSGSGTNIKMLDYMSAGIPVITSPIGARGLDLENYVHAIVCPADLISEKISELLSDEKLRDRLRTNARALVDEKYSWVKISERVEKRLKEIL